MITAGPDLFSEALEQYQLLDSFTHICSCCYRFKKLWQYPQFRQPLIEEACRLVGDRHPEVPNPGQASLFPFNFTTKQHREYRLQLLQQLVDTKFTVKINK